jgi:hypothetical protein
MRSSASSFGTAFLFLPALFLRTSPLFPLDSQVYLCQVASFSLTLSRPFITAPEVLAASSRHQSVRATEFADAAREILEPNGYVSLVVIRLIQIQTFDGSVRGRLWLPLPTATRRSSSLCSTTRHEGAWRRRGVTSVLEGSKLLAFLLGRALLPAKGPQVSLVQEAVWAPEQVWTQRLEEYSLPLSGIEPRLSTPYSDIILTELLSCMFH